MEDILQLADNLLMTSIEAAVALGVNVSTIRYRIEAGRIDGIKKGGTWLVRRSDVDLLIRVRRLGQLA